MNALIGEDKQQGTLSTKSIQWKPYWTANCLAVAQLKRMCRFLMLDTIAEQSAPTY